MPIETGKGIEALRLKLNTLDVNECRPVRSLYKRGKPA